jgi:hypothetical protein
MRIEFQSSIIHLDGERVVNRSQVRGARLFTQFREYVKRDEIPNGRKRFPAQPKAAGYPFTAKFRLHELATAASSHLERRCPPLLPSACKIRCGKAVPPFPERSSSNENKLFPDVTKSRRKSEKRTRNELGLAIPTE